VSAVPEIDAIELGNRLQSDDAFILLDVREVWEIEAVRIQDARLRIIPMSLMAKQAISVAELPRDAEILVLCHHGIRSIQVTRWLLEQGWQKVFSVRGGVHQYALHVDPSVGMY